MSEMEDKLQKLLSDPQSMAQAISMVSSIMGGSSGGETQNKNDEETNSASENSQQTDSEIVSRENGAVKANSVSDSIDILKNTDMSGIIGKMLPQLMGTMAGSGGIDKNKMNLLMAVKPFCESQHQKSIDHAINLVKIAKTAQAAMKSIPKGFFGNAQP